MSIIKRSRSLKERRSFPNASHYSTEQYARMYFGLNCKFKPSNFKIGNKEFLI